ncbi:MAG: AAA family ATPase, partial [Vicinamibacterales bacterium]
MTRFQLRTLRLVRADENQQWHFRPGVTVIVGPVGVGKTSLFEMVKYGLGGNGLLSDAVKQVAVRIELDVELETGDFTLSR